MINIGAEDYNVLKQQYIKKYIRLELLDFQYNIVDELSGNMTKCSINVDSNSDLRRSCDLGFVVTTSTFDIKAGSKLWLDKFCRPYVGYENMRTGEIQWYNQGIYLVNNPKWSYDASINEISMQALDLMSKLTGLRNGNLEGIPTKIAKDENVREAIIKTIELGGFTKYVCEECKTKDGTIVPVPYDIEIDVGGTVYDILSSLRDIMPNYQIYFDVSGVFHYEPIPLAYDDPVLIDDDLWTNLLISENINTDFENVKNYVEVLGYTWDVDYYSPSESTTVSNGKITPTFADLTALEDGTAVGITLPSAATSEDGLIISFLGDNDIIDINNHNVKSLPAEEELIFQMTPYEGTNGLPDGYTKLYYIQSNGTQYIDSGFKPNQYTRVLAEMQCVSSSGGVPSSLFGYSKADSTQRYEFYQYNNLFYSPYNNATGTSLPLVTAKIKINKRRTLTSVNGENISAGSYTQFQCDGNMYIFALNKEGSLENLSGEKRLYSFEIYDSSTLVRNFIPCKNPSGVVGLYEMVEGKFYQNKGTGEFIAGADKPEDLLMAWRYMGHQQARAISYDNNLDSPFYVGNPIGSSSVGRIRIVLYGGEYDNIYSDDLAKQRADFEIYQRARLNDSITMTTVPIPWMDANIVISHRFGQKEIPSKYIVKSFSVDYATGGTMTINAITWYPYYEESEVV